MSSFLEVCQMSRQECGMGGAGPTNTTGQTGAMATVVQRTSQAWIDIQKSKPYWKFLRAKFTMPLEIDVQEYTVSGTLGAGGYGLTTVDKWDKQSCWIYLTSTADERRLIYLPYQDFRAQFRTYPAGRPKFWTEGPDGTILYDKTPDAAYTITKDYWMTPERLVNATDIPACPEQFHDLIAWKSVMKFAGSESAVELFNYAKSEYTPMYLQLCIDQMDVPAAVRSYPIAFGGRSPGLTFDDAS